MIRHSRQRDAIRDAITRAGRPLLPQEVHQLAQQQAPRLGIATVYRNLQALQDAGEINQVTIPGDSPRFELAEQPHHHHFKCTQCGEVTTLYACPGKLAELAPQGYQMHRHELTLYGHCEECTKTHPIPGP